MIKKFIAGLILSTMIYGGDTMSPLNSIMNGDKISNSSSNINDINIEKKKSYSELIAFLSKSTNGQYVMSLAVIYLNGMPDPDIEGKTISPDLKKAIKYFNKSINLGYYESAAILGSLYLLDERFKKEKDNIKKARYYSKLAIDKGIYSATVTLSNIYFYYDKDADNGLKYLYLGAKHNLASAELSLAVLYAYGSKDLDIEKNMVLANQFLEKACTNKNKNKKVEEFCSSKYVLNYKKNEVK